MKAIKINFLLLTILLFSCQQETFKMTPLKIPSDIVLTTQLKGVNASNPNGDGSGEVTFVATAKNAITYQFVLGTDKQLFPSGTYTHTFTKIGVHGYTVTILAKGAGGATVSTTKTVKVLVNYTPPANLLKMLHGDSEKRWRIKSTAKGHLGVGPVASFIPIWWSANPNDKSGKGIYDDQIIFRKNGTYQYETNGRGFGKKAAMDADFPKILALGLSGTSGGDYENVPLGSFGGTWSIMAPKGKETLVMSGKGYLGMYVGGNHKYYIQKRSTNEMSVRTVGSDGNAWYMILTSL